MTGAARTSPAISAMSQIDAIIFLPDGSKSARCRRGNARNVGARTNDSEAVHESKGDRHSVVASAMHE